MQDEKLPFGKIELNNTGMDDIVKQTISDEWYLMLLDPDFKEIGSNLIKYSFFKEGYQFGPKTFYHVIPVNYFTAIQEGRDLNKDWRRTAKDSDLTLDMEDMHTFVNQFLRNNWSNSSYVPQVQDVSDKTEVADVFWEDGIPIFKMTTENSKFYSDGNFTNFVKYRREFKEGDKDKVETILLEKFNTVLDSKGAIEVTTMYKPTNKLGNSQLNEYNLNANNLESSLPDNNKYLNYEVKSDIKTSAPVAEIEVLENDAYSKGLITSEMIHKETIKDILESFNSGLMSEKFAELGLNETKINNLTEEESGDILDKLCAGKTKFGR